MKNSLILSVFFLFGIINTTTAQQTGHDISVHVSINKELKKDMVKNGRMYLFLSEDLKGDPYKKTAPMPWYTSHIFAKNIDSFNPKAGLVIKQDQDWISTVDWTLDNVPEGEYSVQVLWDKI